MVGCFQGLDKAGNLFGSVRLIIIFWGLKNQNLKAFLNDIKV